MAEVARYRLERMLMGCADPPSKGVGDPISVLELTRNEVDGWGERGGLFDIMRHR